MEGTRMTMMIGVVVVMALLFIVPDVIAKPIPKTKIIQIENNYTSYLSLRCFTFYDSGKVKHLASGQKFKFRVKTEVPLFPSATMWNCSTNMGTFVAYTLSYPCATDEVNPCRWKFDASMTYMWSWNYNVWVAIEYNPNYESLSRGGVIPGYYVN